jgi:phosphate transport system substrate-binding protein
MIQRSLIILTLTAIAFLCVHAQNTNSSSHHQTAQAVERVIRIWGDDQMDTVMKGWQEGFRKQSPNVSFETKLFGTGTGMAGLYTGVADLALMGREATSSEVMAFEWVFRYKPLSVEVATGSLAVPGKTFAIAVFVHKDNPLSKMTFTQLDGIFGSEHRRGSRNIRTWGELGLTGEWQDRPINTYGYDTEANTGSFFKRRVFNGSDKWNCGLKEFADVNEPDGSVLDAGQLVLGSLAHDRYGIAYSNLRDVNREVKSVSLSATDEGTYYEATKENLIQRKYPLTRAVLIYANRGPAHPLDPNVKEFLRYILSQEGQQPVARAGDFLPLTAEIIREQLYKLD